MNLAIPAIFSNCKKFDQTFFQKQTSKDLRPFMHQLHKMNIHTQTCETFGMKSFAVTKWFCKRCYFENIFHVEQLFYRKPVNNSNKVSTNKTAFRETSKMFS